MINIQTRPEDLSEIRRAVDIHLAEQGISRSAYAVRFLGIAPATLHQMLHGKQSPASHPSVVLKINELTGSTMESWEK